MRRFSIIIVSRNRYAKLKRALISLIRRAAPAGALKQILLIDNDSTDETKNEDFKAIVTRIPLHLFRNTISYGPAQNKNRGISNADADFIILLDDDAYIESLDLEAASLFFDTHPDVGIIAPRIVYPGGTLQESVRAYPFLAALTWRALQLYRFWIPQWYRSYVDPIPRREHLIEPVEIEWAIGACQIIRRDLFTQIGPLDEKLFFYEDAEFCLRARRAGFKTYYWPFATVVHDYARTSANPFSRAFLRHFVGMVRFFFITAWHRF